MADESPAPAAPDAAPFSDTLPLGEFVRQRNAAQDVPPPQGTPPPAEAAADPDNDASDVASTPQERAAKASRTRGELQKRIDGLVRAKGDAESKYHGTLTRVQALEQELAQLRQGNGKAPSGNGHAAPAPEPARAEPTLDDFIAAGRSYEDFAEYRAERIADARIEARLTQEREAAAQRAAQQTFQQQVAGFPERAAAVRAVRPDFDQVVTQNESVVLSPVMQDVCLRAPEGAEIMYWLGTHPEAARKVAQISQAYPPQAFDLVHEHLLALAGSAGAPAPTGTGPATPITRAPAPISPVGGGGTSTSRSLDDVPLGEFVRRRNAELDRRHGGGR